MANKYHIISLCHIIFLCYIIPFSTRWHCNQAVICLPTLKPLSSTSTTTQAFPCKGTFPHSNVLLSDQSLCFSAAKAPYLARFKVRKCNVDELERVGMENNSGAPNLHTIQEDDNKLNLGEEYWTAAIFKVGDDVRQV